MVLDTSEVDFVISSITMYNMWCLLWDILHYNCSLKHIYNTVNKQMNPTQYDICVKTHYGDSLYIIALYFFHEWMFFNPNHVNTKEFHNFLHIMVEYNPHIELKKMNYFLCISWWIGIHLHENDIYSHVLKNVNIF
jgi:hypothetical protein